MRWNSGVDGFSLMNMLNILTRFDPITLIGNELFNVLIPLLLPRPFSGPGKVPC